VGILAWMVLLIVLVATIPATIAVLVAMFALFRQLMSLSKVAARFSEELQPVSAALQAGVRDAQGKMETLPAKVPSSGAGDKLRS
jgi:hypothetical protein